MYARINELIRIKTVKFHLEFKEIIEHDNLFVKKLIYSANIQATTNEYI